LQAFNLSFKQTDALLFSIHQINPSINIVGARFTAPAMYRFTAPAMYRFTAPPYRFIAPTVSIPHERV